jgi:probable F420-dependent oxidoreductase
VKIETLLPLGKVDPGLRAAEQPLDIDAVGADAQLVESLGYDRLVVEETKDDPFIIMALAAASTSKVGLGTSVAIAFPRSPAITAMSAWTLQKQSRGRFCLGLGPQVRGHIQRRYGLKWSPPGPWMCDYIGAVRALWECWQNGTPLDYRSEHYNLNLMVPLFNPGPIEHPDIPIVVAAIGPRMCEAGGQVANGIRPHPVCTPKFINEAMLPAVRAGAEKTGRSLDGFEIAMKPLVATAPNEEILAQRVRDARARIAFYCSTPAYRRAFEIHGLGDLARELAVLSKAGRWEEMPERISDDILHTYVTVGTYDEIGDKLVERYGNVVTSVEFSIAVTNDDEKSRLGDLVDKLHGAADEVPDLQPDKAG